MEAIKNRLKENRPNLSQSSLKTYVSILKNLYMKVFDKKEVELDDFCNKREKILDYLKDIPFNKRKTILSALVVACQDKESIDTYREQMMKDGKEYEAMISKNEKTETQKENWLTQEEIQNIYTKHKKNAEKLFKSKELSMNELQILQNYIILSLYTLLPPRRLLDYTEMKVRGYGNHDNYYKGGMLVFNRYKTAKFYGEQKIEIPVELKRVLNKWVKLHANDYLLFDGNGNKLSSVTLNQRLNKIFGKKASVNILRHSFLSEKYKDMPRLEEMKKTAEMMSHRVGEAMEYVKR